MVISEGENTSPLSERVSWHSPETVTINIKLNSKGVGGSGGAFFAALELVSNISTLKSIQNVENSDINFSALSLVSTHGNPHYEHNKNTGSAMKERQKAEMRAIASLLSQEDVLLILKEARALIAARLLLAPYEATLRDHRSPYSPSNR